MAIFPNLLLCGVVSFLHGALAVHQLPTSFLGRTITSNTFDDISAAISLVELDDFLEVVLVGNYTQSDAVSLSNILEEAATYSIVRPLKAHIYEKKIFRVSLAAGTLTQSVIKAVSDDSPLSLSRTLTSHHMRLGVATTVFVVSINVAQEWTNPSELTGCATLLNMRSPGAAWIYIDLENFKNLFSIHTMAQYFNGFTELYAYELANNIQQISEVLMPFPTSEIRPPTALKEFIFLEISICDSYTRSEPCPLDSLVADSLRGMHDLQGENDHIVIRSQSVTFNIHDYPPLSYAVHAASHYVETDREYTGLDMELLLYHTTRCRAIQQAISRVVDIGGRNKDHKDFKLIPIFNFHFDGNLNYRPRHGAKIQSFVMPRWEGDENVAPYPSPRESKDIVAILRLRSGSVNSAGLEYSTDYFTPKRTIPCSDIKITPQYWNGHLLFDTLTEVAWDVRLPEVYGMVEITNDDYNSRSVLTSKSVLFNDFRRLRSVDRSVIISRLEQILSELNTMVLAYSRMPSNGVPSIGSRAGDKDFNASPRYYEDITELVNIELENSDGVEVFLNIIHLIDKSAAEFSHLNYGVVKTYLSDLNILLEKLSDIYEFASSRQVGGRTSIKLNWNNAIDAGDEEMEAGQSDTEVPVFTPSPKMILAGSLFGFFLFFLVKLFQIFFIDTMRGNISVGNDPFRRHANRSVQKRM